MPQLNPYISQLTPQGEMSNTATAEDFGGGVGKALQKGGEAAASAATDVQDVEEQKARMRTAANLTQIDTQYRTQMEQAKTDPDFASKYGDDGSGFAASFKDQFETDANGILNNTDPMDRKYMQTGLYNLGQSLYGNALDFQAKTGAAFAVNTVKSAVDNARQSANMAPDQYMSIMANANMVISQAKVDPDTRLKLQDAATQEVTLGAALGRLKSGGVGAANQILNDTMMFNTIGEDGKPKPMSLRNIIDEKTYTSLSEQADRTVKEATAQAKQAISDQVSDLHTSIAFAESPDDFVNIKKQIEDNAGTFGTIKANELRVEVHHAEKGILKQIQMQDNGRAFASGEAVPNPGNDEDVKAVDTYYSNELSPKLAGKYDTKDPQAMAAKNTELSRFVANTGIIPPQMDGDIQIKSRSQKPEDVVEAADLVQRITQRNPALASKLEQAPTARAFMVAQKITEGMSGDDAIKYADAQLNPATKGVYDGRKEVLAKAKIDYQSKALANVPSQSGILKRAMPGDSRTTAPIGNTAFTAQLTADYKGAYDNQFQLTGDAKAAEDYANKMVSARYGTTNVNPQSSQLVPYPPEHYYSIPGVSDSWMRDQMLETAKENSGRFKDYDEKNVYVVPDAMTARTASTGAPRYKLMYLNKNNDTYEDMLGGKYFYFDKKPALQKNIDAARAQDQAIKNHVTVLPGGEEVK